MTARFLEIILVELGLPNINKLSYIYYPNEGTAVDATSTIVEKASLPKNIPRDFRCF